MMPQRRFCSLCDIFLLDPSEKNVCPTCLERVAIDPVVQYVNCPRCGRFQPDDDVFECNFCWMTICSGCCYDEHNQDVCYDDEEY